MAAADDLWASLYGEAPSDDEAKPSPPAAPPPAAAAPPPPPPLPPPQLQPQAAAGGGESPPPPPPDDDDDEELDIVLDEPVSAYGAAAAAPAAGGDDEEDDEDFDVQLDEDAVASAVPAPAGGGVGADGAPLPPGAPPPPPPPPPRGANFSMAPQGAPLPGGGAMARHKPVLPKYPVNNDLPPVLPSQAAPGQHVRLPGQSRVTPEEYREFLGLGHGEIFNLDIDLVVDAPWDMPGVDPTDFFNYQLTPDTWKDYCAVVHQFRNEFTMQKRINTFAGHAPAPPVFVDPELPPELRAAVAAQRMRAAPGAPPGFAQHMLCGPAQHAYAPQQGFKVEHAAQPLPPGVAPAPIATHPGPRPPGAPHVHMQAPPTAPYGAPMRPMGLGAGIGVPYGHYGEPQHGMSGGHPMAPPHSYGAAPPGAHMRPPYGAMYGAMPPQFAGQMAYGGGRAPYPGAPPPHEAPPPPPAHQPPPPAPAADPPRRARPDVSLGNLAMGMDMGGSRRRDDDRRRRDDDRDRDRDRGRHRRSRSRSRERSRRH